MVQKISHSLPLQRLSAILPQNRVVRVVLLSLGALITIRIVRSLCGIATPPANPSAPDPGPSSFSATPDSLSDEKASKLVEQGMAYLNSKEFRLALEKFQAAESLNPSSPEVKFRLWQGQAKVYILTSSSAALISSPVDSVTDKKAAELIDQGMGHLGLHERQLALEKFQEAEALNPNSPEVKARLWLGQAEAYIEEHPKEFDLGMEKLKLVFLQEGVTKSLKGQAFKLKGMMDFEKGQAFKRQVKRDFERQKYSEALIDFFSAFDCDLSPLDHIVIKLKICRVFCGQGRFVESLKQCRETLKSVEVKDKHICFELIQLSRITELYTRYEEALEYNQAVYDNIPDENHHWKIHILSHRGYILYEFKKYDDCLKVLEEVLKYPFTEKENFMKCSAYRRQAMAYEALKEKGKAIQSYTEALKFAVSPEKEIIQEKIRNLK